MEESSRRKQLLRLCFYLIFITENVHSASTECIRIHANITMPATLQFYNKGVTTRSRIAVDGQPFFFYYPPVIVTAEYKERLTYNITETVIMITIDKTTLSDAGNYSLFNFRVNPSILLFSIELYIMGEPFSPVIIIENNGTVGWTKGLIKCETASTSKPNGYDFVYTWRRNDQIIGTEGNKYIFKEPGGQILEIKVDRNETLNEYTCSARENFGISSEISTAIKLHPNYRPTVTVSPDYNQYNVKENTTNLQLTCTVIDANPAVTSYRWYKGNLFMSNMATYTIPTVLRSHTGSYKCDATNSVGTSIPSSALQLDVLFGPGSSLKFDPNAISLTKTKGEQLGPVNCVATCNPPCQYTWTKPNKTTIQGGQLVLAVLSIGDHGEFICSASNNIGESQNKSLDVTVNFKPVLDHTRPYSPPYVSAAENNSLHLQLTINGNPPPTTEWTFKAEADWNSCNFITIVSNTTTNGFLTSSSILIDDIQSDIFGEYTFSANNTVGTFFRRFVVMKEAHLAQMKCPIKKENNGMFLAGIVTLVVGLMSLTAAVVFVVRNGLKNKVLNSSKYVEYSDMQRSNPAFTDAYTTLQPNIESTVPSEQSINNYEECGRTPEAHTYSSVDNKESELSQYQQHGVNTYEECGKRIDAHAYDTFDK